MNDINDIAEAIGKKPELPKTFLDFMSIDFPPEYGGTQLILASMKIGENEYYAVTRGLREDDPRTRFLKLKGIKKEDGTVETFDIVEYTSIAKQAEIARKFMGQSEEDPQTES